MYSDQFKDFDNGEAFKKILTALTPYGFHDSSWRNDLCPSMMNSESCDDGIQIWVDYLDPEKSEWTDERKNWTMKMFAVIANGNLLFQTNNIDELITKLTPVVETD